MAVRIHVAGGSSVKMQVARLHGLKVRTRSEIRTGAMVIPAGTVCTVYSTWRSGVNMDAPPCDCCKIRVHIRRVHRDGIELLEAPPDATE
jgi:hypothetical protein